MRPLRALLLHGWVRGVAAWPWGTKWGFAAFTGKWVHTHLKMYIRWHVESSLLLVQSKIDSSQGNQNHNFFKKAFYVPRSNTSSRFSYFCKWISLPPWHKGRECRLSLLSAAFSPRFICDTMLRIFPLFSSISTPPSSASSLEFVTASTPPLPALSSFISRESHTHFC